MSITTNRRKWLSFSPDCRSSRQKQEINSRIPNRLTLCSRQKSAHRLIWSDICVLKQHRECSLISTSCSSSTEEDCRSLLLKLVLDLGTKLLLETVWSECVSSKWQKLSTLLTLKTKATPNSRASLTSNCPSTLQPTSRP